MEKTRIRTHPCLLGNLPEAPSGVIWIVTFPDWGYLPVIALVPKAVR